MRKDNRTNIIIRYFLVILAILAFAAFNVYRLIGTTLVDADNWNAKADSVLLASERIIPPRGNILAADGSVLATNLNFYTARIDYRAEKFSRRTLRDSISRLSDEMARLFPQRTSQQWHDYILKPLLLPDTLLPRSYKLISGLSHTDMELLKTLPYFNIGNRNRTGLIFEKQMRRFNPYGDMARRSIGGVGETTKSKEIHGISGLEKALDSLLYGREGTTRKVNLTKKIADMTLKPAVPGTDIVTTIDIAMQDIVENELNNVLDTCRAEWGVAVLMDVATGDIKAISNLELNPRGPGYIEACNRAVMGYEPGSVIKTLSMMIALEDGIVTNLNEVIPTGRSWAYAGGRPISDSHQTESMRVSEVLEQSSNIAMARIITRKYNDHPGAFYSRIKKMGFLDPMFTGIAGERRPRIDSVPNDRGGRIALSRQCYGYATEIPPLYTLALYNAIANNGIYVRPRLFKELRGTVDSILPVGYMGNGRACSPETAKTLREMLLKVVWGEHGTGRFLQNDVVKIAGKTGTSYVIDPQTRTYNTAEKRLTFCGFFPAEAPRYSCIALICHPTRKFVGAGTTSGQVVRNIAMKLYSRGLLGNSSEYRQLAPTPQPPTFFASTLSDPYANLSVPFAIPGRRSLKIPDSTLPGIPDVRGLSIREAVAILENAGYNVAMTGAGFVHAQTPSPGTRAKAGAKVKLTLGR